MYRKRSTQKIYAGSESRWEAPDRLYTETDEAFEARAIKLANAANKRAVELKRKSVGRIRSAVNDAFNEDEEARVRRERAKPLIDTGSFRKSMENPPPRDDDQVDAGKFSFEVTQVMDAKTGQEFNDAMRGMYGPETEGQFARAARAGMAAAARAKPKHVELYQPGKRKIKL